MASIRERKKADGTKYWSVVYRDGGKQTSTTFGDFAEATQFAELAKKFGIKNALEAVKVAQRSGSTGLTVGEWIRHHLDHLTGVDPGTITKYEAYLRNDISESLGSMPLTALTRDHIAQWMKGMQQPNAKGKVVSAKTVQNKHGFLAGCLNAAVAAGHIPANAALGMGMPRDDEEREPIFLTREQFTLLHSSVTEYWRPLVEFLVASGCRWGEAVGLKPSDIDVDAGTVRIARSWKYGGAEIGYKLGRTKTKKSKRTINVPASTLAKLDLSPDREFVFLNRAGGPVRAQGFFNRIWTPALEKAWPSVDASGNPVKDPFRPRVHDLRHTNASWQIQAGVPLPVVQQHLGHESITTTINTYGHLDRSSMKLAAEAIGSVLAPA